MSDHFSIIEYFDDKEAHKCGYCKSNDSSYSHGMWCHHLRPQEYQDLIDRGWRRSGKYCYKPIMDKTCCPQYTIRCPVTNFKLSKSHKKVLKRMHKFLAYGTTKNAGDPSSSDMDIHPDEVDEAACNILQEQPADVMMAAHQNLEDKQLPVIQPSLTQPAKPEKEPPSLPTVPKEVENKGAVNSTLCKKAKLLRKERKLEKLRKKAKEEGLPEPDPKEVFSKKNPEAKSLEDFLSEPMPPNPVHRLQVVHKPPSDSSYELFHQYQRTIHKESESECGFTTFEYFLLNTPLEQTRDGLPYGSYHQHYLLDGELIAVGVVDILPTSVSSVYLFYNPQYSFLSLGTYAALREIAFTRELHRRHPEIQYYYMGFYIHSCPKMRYKGQFHPSYLLCPETYIWRPILECLPLLDISKYSRLNPDPTAVDHSAPDDVDKVLVLYRRQIMAFGVYRQMKNVDDTEEESVKKYAQLVGPISTTNLLIYRSSQE